MAGLYVTVDSIDVDVTIVRVLDVARPLVRAMLDRLAAGTLAGG